MKLIIANKNYSTWSLRPWLLLKAHHIEFDEINVSLREDGLRQRLLQYSESAKMPVLHDEGLVIWDTLAICEYISEVYLAGKGWPIDAKQRAIARSITAEMHSGYGNIRNDLPMNIRAKRKVDISKEVQREIDYIDNLWAKCQQDGYLFGDYGIVDGFFTPVASRFNTYGIKLSSNAQIYADKLLTHPAMQEWSQAARLETETLPVDEAGVDV
ncbi:MAG: glutathione S-transferase family protein [Rhizobiales bacterium]|nr:glutathione S-transferase family protein [Hyphomicrobiales bacterium]NRB14403.1 glutathione S-transferase family protein [Hyphomicrobiales bacterium]